MELEPISKDLGNLKREQPIGHQRSTEPMPSDDTEETTEQKLESLRRALGVASLDYTFEHFDIVPGTVKAFEAFKAMAAPGHKAMLLCYGGVGNGKSYLCEALSIALYKQNIRCPVSVWPDVIRLFQKGMHRPDPGHPPYDYLFDQFRSREMLIIDDVGMGATSKPESWAWGELEEIINYRYRERLFTVMATDKDLDELPERVESRFSDPLCGVIVQNKGKDYRKR